MRENVERQGLRNRRENRGKREREKRERKRKKEERRKKARHFLETCHIHVTSLPFSSFLSFSSLFFLSLPLSFMSVNFSSYRICISPSSFSNRRIEYFSLSWGVGTRILSVFLSFSFFLSLASENGTFRTFIDRTRYELENRENQRVSERGRKKRRWLEYGWVKVSSREVNLKRNFLFSMICLEDLFLFLSPSFSLSLSLC